MFRLMIRDGCRHVFAQQAVRNGQQHVFDKKPQEHVKEGKSFCDGAHHLAQAEEQLGSQKPDHGFFIDGACFPCLQERLIFCQDERDRFQLFKVKDKQADQKHGCHGGKERRALQGVDPVWRDAKACQQGWRHPEIENGAKNSR